MKDKFLSLTRSTSVRNVAVVASGTAVAQALSMLFSPVITRIYGAEAYGLMGVFTAMTAIVVPLTALSYPNAIVLPKKDYDAQGITSLSLSIAFFVSCFLGLLLIFFRTPITEFFNLGEIGDFIFLLPLVMLFSIVLQVLQQWLIRKKQFIVTAKVGILQSFLLNSAKIGIGFINPTGAILILIASLGSVLHSLMLHLSVKSKNRSFIRVDFNLASKINLAKEYKDFAIFRTPQVFLNGLSQSLPILMLTTFFGPAAAGFYTLSRTVLLMPSRLLGKSVGDVFYPRIAEAANNNENLSGLIKKATLALASTASFPFILIIAFGPWLFALIFGEEWRIAGDYSRWLALWLYMALLNRPAVVAIPVLKLQGEFLVFEIFSTILRAIALALGFILFRSDVIAMAIFSVTGFMLNFFLILFVYKKSKKYHQIFKKNE